MRRLRRWERETIRSVLIDIKLNGYAVLDGETARKLGRLLSDLGVRKYVIIGNDRRARKSVVLDTHRKLLDYLRVI